MTAVYARGRRPAMGGLPGWIDEPATARRMTGATEERLLVSGVTLLYAAIAAWVALFPGLLPAVTRPIGSFWKLGERVALSDAAGHPLLLILRVPLARIEWVASHDLDRLALAVVASGLLAHVACAAVQASGFSRTQRITLVASLMLNPVTVLYGTGRPDEALFVAAVAMATLQAFRWSITGELSAFIVAAMAFGVAAVTARAGVIVAAVFLVPILANAAVTRRGRRGRTTALAIAYAAPVLFAIGLATWLGAMITEQEQIGLLGSAYGSVWDAYFGGIPDHVRRLVDGRALYLVLVDAPLIAPSLAVAVVALGFATVRRGNPVPAALGAAALLSLLAIAALSVDASPGFTTLQPAGAVPIGFVLGLGAVGYLGTSATDQTAARLRLAAIAVSFLVLAASSSAVALHWGAFT